MNYVKHCLSTTHQARWAKAVQLFSRLKDAANQQGCKIWYEMEYIDAEQLRIENDEIYVKIGNCLYTQYSADPSLDEGLYETSAQTEKRVRKSFKLFKEIAW